MTQDSSTPYAPPASTVSDEHPSPDQGSFLGKGRRVPTGHGWDWLTDAWQLFRLDPFTWILIWVVFLLLVMASGLVPFGSYLLPPLLSGGIMLGCQRLRDSGELEIGDLFSGFRKHTAPLLIQGLLYLAGMCVIMIPLVVIGIICAIAMAPILDQGGSDATLLALALISVIGLLVLALMLPVMAAIWFAPALIVLHDMTAVDAMKASFAACFKNWLPMTLYSVFLLLLILAGLLTCCLGFVIVGPLFTVSVYTSYRDIFFEE